MGANTYGEQQTQYPKEWKWETVTQYGQDTPGAEEKGS